MTRNSILNTALSEISTHRYVLPFSPSEGNSVSRALASDRNLRNRVLNQAKLYGLASTIETGSLNVDDGAVPKLQIPVPENEDDLVRFAAVARRVETAPSTRLTD